MVTNYPSNSPPYPSTTTDTTQYVSLLQMHNPPLPLILHHNYNLQWITTTTIPHPTSIAPPPPPQTQHLSTSTIAPQPTTKHTTALNHHIGTIAQTTMHQEVAMLSSAYNSSDDLTPIIVVHACGYCSAIVCTKEMKVTMSKKNGMKLKFLWPFI